MKTNNYKYYIVYKPFGMLPQFTDSEGRPTLAKLFEFPKDVYPIGRLDMDSEGLLIISNDKQLNHTLLNPDFEHTRTYLVQLDGEIDSESCESLKNGVEIVLNNEVYLTKPGKAEIVSEPYKLPYRNPPVRFRANIPTSWIELSIIEGKNRQVRRMTAKVGFPTLRLIRKSIENLELPELKNSGVWEMTRDEIYKKLRLR